MGHAASTPRVSGRAGAWSAPVSARKKPDDKPMPTGDQAPAGAADPGLTQLGGGHARSGETETVERHPSGARAGGELGPGPAGEPSTADAGAIDVGTTTTPPPPPSVVAAAAGVGAPPGTDAAPAEVAPPPPPSTPPPSAPPPAPSLFRAISEEVAIAAAAASMAAGGPHRPDLVGPPRPPCNPERLVELHRLMAVEEEEEGEEGGGGGAAPAKAPRDPLAPVEGDTRTPQVDHIVSLLCRLLGADDALLALLDGERVYIRDAAGRTFTPGNFPWRCSFCGWCLASPTPQVLIVPDAAADARFAANPFVAGPPGIRFYAGAPVVARSGHRLGTLCIAGTAPRTVSAADVATLATLADLVAVEIERDAAMAKDVAAAARLRAATAAAAAARAAGLGSSSGASSSSAQSTPSPSPPPSMAAAPPPGGALLIDTGGGGADPATWTALHVSAGAAAALGPPGEAGRAATGEAGAPAAARLFGGLVVPRAGLTPGLAADLAAAAAAGRAFVVRDVLPAGSPPGGPAFDAAFHPAAKGPPAGLGGEVGVPPRVASAAATSAGPTTPGIYSVLLTPAAGAAPPPPPPPPQPPTPRPAGAGPAAPLQTARTTSSCLDPIAAASPIPGLNLGVLVGKGSHGRVWRGTLGAEAVAIKVISDAVRGVRRAGDGTPLECYTAAGLAHPCLVRTHAWARVHGGGGGRVVAGAGLSAPPPGHAVGSAGVGVASPPASTAAFPPTPVGAVEAARPVAPVTPPLLSSESEDASDGGSDTGSMAAAAPPLPALPTSLTVRTSADRPLSRLGSSRGPRHGLPATPASVALSRYGSIPPTPPQEEGETWVVLDWCDLGTLQEAVDVGMFRTAPSPTAPPEPRTVHAAAADIAAGLAALHAAGVSHGDLTAHNVLLASVAPRLAVAEGRPGPWRAKISDFGLSAPTASEAGSDAGCGEEGGGGGGGPSSPTSAAASGSGSGSSSSSPYGCITHMPPEVLARGGGPSRPADVYSYGVLLWSLAAGCRPWAGLTFAQVLAAVGLEGRRPRFESLPGPLPPWLVELGEACMHPVASSRPSMETVVAVLAGVAVQEGWGPAGGGGVWRLPVVTDKAAPA